MTALHDCSPAERLHAIECAARVLQTAWPKRQQFATLPIGGRFVPVVYSWLPSGALNVTHKDTGAIVAQSVPALLSVLDPDLFPGELPEGEDEAFSLVADCFVRAELLRGLAEVLKRPHFRALSAPELAFVLSAWADQLNDD